MNIERTLDVVPKCPFLTRKRFGWSLLMGLKALVRWEMGMEIGLDLYPDDQTRQAYPRLLSERP